VREPQRRALAVLAAHRRRPRRPRPVARLLGQRIAAVEEALEERKVETLARTY
jgi:hypothetical protein